VNQANLFGYPPVIGLGIVESTGPTDMSAHVHARTLVLNPTDAAIGGGDCDVEESASNVVLETLVKKYNYFQPTNTVVRYYQQVYFDGVAVQKDVHYTIQDTYKIVPTDNEVLVDTEVTALVVR
jgi:hypothetical protein